MIYETKRHPCFLCGRKLDDALVIWDKNTMDKYGTMKIINAQNGVATPVHGVSVMCECGLVQELDPMTQKSLYEFYSGDDKNPSPYRKIYPTPDQAVINHNSNTINFMFQMMGQPPVGLRILVVGAGDLTAVEMYQHVFPQSICYTYEPGLPESDINYQSLPDSQFDLIICNNTLEHVYDPVQFMKELRHICTPLTKIIISVPDLMASCVTLPRSAWFSSAHLYHFTVDSLAVLLVRTGYKLATTAQVIEEIGEKIYAILLIDTNFDEAVMATQPKALPMEIRKKIKNYVLNVETLFDRKVDVCNEYTKFRGPDRSPEDSSKTGSNEEC
jgi:SAM-dependent methyltransferase